MIRAGFHLRRCVHALAHTHTHTHNVLKWRRGIIAWVCVCVLWMSSEGFVIECKALSKPLFWWWTIEGSICYIIYLARRVCVYMCLSHLQHHLSSVSVRIHAHLIFWLIRCVCHFDMILSLLNNCHSNKFIVVERNNYFVVYKMSNYFC